LMRTGAARLTHLADQLHIAARSATELVDALEQRGLAARSPDPDDRRATLVTLTSAGARVGATVSAARGQEAARFFGRLVPDDQAELRRILRSLLDD